jgi:hypothetical protein
MESIGGIMNKISNQQQRVQDIADKIYYNAMENNIEIDFADCVEMAEKEVYTDLLDATHKASEAFAKTNHEYDFIDFAACTDALYDQHK